MDLKILEQKVTPNINTEGRQYGETVETVYECPCGKGKTFLHDEKIPGFSDFHAYIECEECNERYELQWGRGVSPGCSPMVRERPEYLMKKTN